METWQFGSSNRDAISKEHLFTFLARNNDKLKGISVYPFNEIHLK
jgi:hypothetical protein